MVYQTCQASSAAVSKQLGHDFRDEKISNHPLEDERDDTISEDLPMDDERSYCGAKTEVPVQQIKICREEGNYECPTYVSVARTDSTEATSTSSSQIECEAKSEKNIFPDDASYLEALEREKARKALIAKGETKINYDGLILTAWESCVPAIHDSDFSRSDLLYFKAIESERKKVAMREAAAKPVKPKLKLEARSSRFAQKARSISTPCHIRLYKLASKPKNSDLAYKAKEEKLTRVVSSDAMRGQLASIRLYNHSIPLQEYGRKKREAIAEAIAKSHEEFVHPTNKLPLSMADRMYYRGVAYLLYVEQKKMESAARRNTTYAPSIVP